MKSKAKGKSLLGVLGALNPFKNIMKAVGSMLSPAKPAAPRITTWVHSETRVAKAAAKRERKAARNRSLWHGGGYAATRKWLDKGVTDV